MNMPFTGISQFTWCLPGPAIWALWQEQPLYTASYAGALLLVGFKSHHKKILKTPPLRN